MATKKCPYCILSLEQFKNVTNQVHIAVFAER